MKFLGLFQGFGIELEYMIVDRDDLRIRPISDTLLKDTAGAVVSDCDDGPITWSNELVMHVIELKTTTPAQSLNYLEQNFQLSVGKINRLLAVSGAQLMPTAMHPLMNPAETKLWPHDNNEIYESYNRIFDCRGHGWSNLQSMHINLPFQNDSEFARLHMAIRFLLPILPALTASSPIVDGEITGTFDNRLAFYQENQKRVPSIAGSVIPEPVESIQEYNEKILQRIYADIKPHDPEGILQEDWLNSRGAIARFERQSIEIRILDIQENPMADLAIADFICATLKILIDGDLVSYANQKGLSTATLKSVFDQVIDDAENTVLAEKNYLRAWNFNLPPSPKAGDLLAAIFKRPEIQAQMSPMHVATFNRLLKLGSLSTRICKAIGDSHSPENIKKVYQRLCECLNKGRLFEP